MLGSLGYLAMMAAIFVESAGVPAPGETALIAASVLAAAGKLNILLVVALAAIAAIAGDNAGYLLGRRLGRAFLARPTGRWARHRQAVLERGERFFDRHGPKAVFLARWLMFARVTSAWLAGATRMRWRTFALYNGLGGIAWAVTVGGATYALGGAGPAITIVEASLGAAVIAAVVIIRCRRRRGTDRSTPQPWRYQCLLKPL